MRIQMSRTIFKIEKMNQWARADQPKEEKLQFCFKLKGSGPKIHNFAYVIDLNIIGTIYFTLYDVFKMFVLDVVVK